MLLVKDEFYTFFTRSSEKPWVFAAPIDYLTAISGCRNLVYLGAFSSTNGPVNADLEQLMYIKSYIDLLKTKDGMPDGTDLEIVNAAARNVTISGAPRSVNELLGRHCIILLVSVTTIHVYALRSKFEILLDNAEASHAYRTKTDTIMRELVTMSRAEVLRTHIEQLSKELYGGQQLPYAKHNIDTITTGTEEARAHAYAMLRQLGVEE